ncbi:MAG TPA: hypothetical protein VF147_08530 [Vicinamibacterales bacterium]
MQPEVHRVWRCAVLAWLLLLAIPSASAAIFWQAGGGRDPDMSGPGELVILTLLALTIPAAALGFAYLGPLAVAADRLAGGRTPRAVNLLIGVALSAPVVLVGMLGAPARGLTPMGRALLATMPIAGLIIGSGLRYRRSAG